MGPASIFISYRRSDAPGHAGRLYDWLKLWFDAGELFYDSASIEAGDVFPQRIEAAVNAAKVVLVLIGPDWLSEINRRAVMPGVDFVRAEVESALRLNSVNGNPRVIPVLLGGARPPSLDHMHETLHAGLQRLPSLHVYEFHGNDSNWGHQFVRLRELIAGVQGVSPPRYRPPAGEPKPSRVIDHLLSPHFRDPTEALARVRETLLADGNVAVVVPAALYGMGGVGKTQLALKYSHEYRENYAGVWWFRAESDNTLQLDAHGACLAVGAVLADGEPPSISFKRWLSHQEQSWLLVFDNAESVTALRPHLPQGGSHHVLITSRDPAWGGVARPIELAVWSEEEGADFFATRLPESGRNDLRRLSRALGGLQLALEQAAAFLEQTRGSVAGYCTQIEGVDTAALVLDEGRASTGYERSVLATLSLAFPHLSTVAQQLLSICAFFSAEPIPERYFLEGAEFLPETLANVAKQALEWERTVGELRHFGIVERIDVPLLDCTPGQSDEGVEKALLLHRLTLEVARHALTMAVENGPRAQQLLRAQCPSDAKDPKQWPRFTALLPHLINLDRLRFQDWLDRRAHSRMLDCVASYLREGKALYRESERILRSALELNRADFGEEHPVTLATMNNLAATLRAQGNLSGARSLQEQALSISRRVLGDEHQATLAMMTNLAEILRSQGDLSGTSALQEQVLSIGRRVLGEEHPGTLVTMNNLAGTLQAQGDLRGARALQEKSLSVIRCMLGEEHSDVLASMNNLASMLREQGDLDGARVLHEHVVAICCRVLGEEHPNTLISMSNMAETQMQGDVSGARVLKERVLSVRRRVLGEEHPDTLKSMHTLAVALWAQGDVDGARTLHEQALSTRRRVLGDRHSDALTSMSDLALTLWRLGACDEAEALMTEAVEGRVSKLGTEHPHTQASINNLSAMRAERNK
jgi:Flp pilus assembly protein TadD